MSLLNPDLDIGALAADWRVDERLRIADILPSDYADEMRLTLEKQVQFNVVLARDGKMAAIAPEQLNQLSQENRQQLQQQMMQDAQKGVGYFYHGHHLNQTTNEALKEFLKRLNAPGTIDTIKKLTGIQDITHADAQATQYIPGHYLTRHRDVIEGESRRLAYVFNLTPKWHPDWGGLLQFYEEDGTPRDAWAPAMNVLSIFDVRHIHAVTYVTPFAGAARHAITGWFRA